MVRKLQVCPGCLHQLILVDKFGYRHQTRRFDKEKCLHGESGCNQLIIRMGEAIAVVVKR